MRSAPTRPRKRDRWQLKAFTFDEHPDVACHMRRLFKCLIALPVVYLVAWTIAYAGIFLSRGDGLDFSHYFRYLGWAWTLRGGELPTFIWYFTFLVFLPLAGLSLFFLARRANNGIDGLTK